MANTTIGQEAEQAALRFLIKQGLSPVETNYYCRRGEIDLIMRDEAQLVFIEVKYRNNIRHGSGLEAVDYYKRQRIIYAARHYLHQHHLTETCISRFDIIDMKPNNQLFSQAPFIIDWLKHAFSLD